MPARYVRRSLWAFGLVVLVLALFAVALPFAASTRIVRDRIALEMSAWSGYRVSIGAAPEIRIWPRFGAVLTNVSLSPWTSAATAPVVDAERVEIELSAMSALHGNVVFSSVRLIRPTLRLEPSASGLDLPQLPGGGRITRAIETARGIVSENRSAPDTGRLPSDPFGTVEFSDGRIVAATPQGENEIATGLAGRVNWSALNRAGSLSATGVWRGEDVAVDISSGNPLLLFAGGAAPVSLSVTSAPGNVQFDGTASLADNAYVDGTARLSTPSLKRVQEWTNAAPSPATAIGAVEIASHVSGNAQRVRLENVELSLDGNPGTGVLELLLTGKRPVLSGTLAFDRLDLGLLLTAFMPAPAGSAAIGSVADQVDVDLRLSAGTAAMGTVALNEVAATARVNDGFAAFDISDARAFGGNVQSGLRLDRKPEGASVELRLLASDIDGGAFSAALGMTRLMPIGRGNVSVILKGPGVTGEALLENANGSISANFGSGALSGFDLNGFLDLAHKGGFFALGDVPSGTYPFDALDLKASVTNGVAMIDRAEARSARSRIALSGIVPLAGRGLALSGSAGPVAQAPAPTGSADPGTTDFFVGGSWDAPFISPVEKTAPIQ